MNIILCGKKSDTAFSDALLPALALYGGARYFSGEKLALYGLEPARFFVYDGETIPKIELDSGILLFKNSFDSGGQVHVPPHFFCILESKNVHAAELLRGTEVSAVTCGTSQKDTISVAGIQEGSAVLSLQRNLVTLEGKVLEPHDFTVSLRSEIGPHRVLAVCAVLLLAGVDSSKGYTI
ncbi:MAG: hypothetical protein GX424_06345 [Clostridiales bacterium]|jgi:hypothetical protein|nr:hypothetical protein [Clostridiales bacterium]